MEVNAIYEGDNLEILSKFPDKSVDLIYADPPFFSNRHYEVIWDDGAEIRAFQDRWKGGIEHYISWMEPRIRECHRILKDMGGMYLHCDWHASAHLRLLLDKVFEEHNFRNEIIWHYKRWSNASSNLQRMHDTIFWYSKSKNYTFNPILQGYSHPEFIEKTVRGFVDGKLVRLKDKKGNYIEREAENKGVLMHDVWGDINFIAPTSKERLGYPTQKPLALLERIINASSNKGEIILDPFCGCGTAIVGAQKLGRKWIGIDVSPTACKLMAKRMQKECGIKANLIRGNVDINYVKKLEPFEFQNWVVINKFSGKVSDRKSGDMGIDGFTPQITGGFPIQVKQSENIGRNVVDNFKSAIQRVKKNKGCIVAYSFGSGAHEEVARLKNQEELEIILRTVKELLEGKVE